MRAPLWTILAVGVVLTALYALASWHVLNAVKTALSKHEPSTQVIVVPAEVATVGEPEQEQDDVLTVPLDGAEMFEATAYTAGRESTGKSPGHPAYGITYSGLPVKLGVVAVDPAVIPLGSVVWVEDYGLAVAADTGSAIKGKRVDVYLPDLGAAMQWGRKDVRVAVLR